jgi:hypothetical protein
MDCLKFIFLNDLRYYNFRLYFCQMLSNAVSLPCTKRNKCIRFKSRILQPSFGHEIERVFEDFVFVLTQYRVENDCSIFWDFESSCIHFVICESRNHLCRWAIDSKCFCEYSFNPFHVFEFFGRVCKFLGVQIL